MMMKSTCSEYVECTSKILQIYSEYILFWFLNADEYDLLLFFLKFRNDSIEFVMIAEYVEIHLLLTMAERVFSNGKVR